VELYDGVLLLPAEVAALDVGAQVVDPAEAAALAAAEQARLLGQRAPVAVAVALDVRHQNPVLLGRPRTPLQPHLLAARRAPHVLICRSINVRPFAYAERAWLACRGRVLARRPSSLLCELGLAGWLSGLAERGWFAVWTGRAGLSLAIYMPPRRRRTGLDLRIEKGQKGKNQTWSKQGASQKGRFSARG
jgi:hypothetical protein